MNLFHRLHELLELLVSDLITPGQHDELQKILQDNSNAQDAYLDFVDLHIGLHKLTDSERSVVGFDALAHDLASVDISRAVSADRRSGLRRRWSRATRVAVGVSSLAVVALVAAFLSSIFLRPEPDGKLANREVLSPPKLSENGRDKIKLVQAAGAELFGERLPPLGASLEYGREYALTAGLLKLRFPDGAEVILEAPSVVRIANRNRLIVSIGSCSVYAPPGAEGFQVRTPRSEIIDLGTRFSVSVNEIGETDVQVVEGLAEVRGVSATSGKPIKLTERQARHIGGDFGDAPQPLTFDSRHYRAQLPDRIVSYRARKNEDGDVSELLNVTVQRNGLAYTYNAADLIGIKVSHFRAGKNHSNVVVAMGYRGDVADVLESDSLLQTGLINPGGAVEPLRDSPVFASEDTGENKSTPGMAIWFRSPVVNGPGPDVVLFELQSVTNPPEGDAFHVSPLQFNSGLRSTTIHKYDITMNSPEAQRLVRFDQFFFKQPVRSLDVLLHGEASQREQVLRFYAIAVGIDLADLGYADGAAVEGLFIQDALDDGNMVDPVFIAGFPEM